MRMEKESNIGGNNSNKQNQDIKNIKKNDI